MIFKKDKAEEAPRQVMNGNGAMDLFAQLMTAAMSSSISAEEIVFEQGGDKFIFPEKAEPRDVVRAAQRWAKSQESIVGFNESIRSAIPTDAAIVFTQMVNEMYPMLTMEGDFSMFGYTPPQVVSVTVGENETYDLYLGNLVLPGFKSDESLRVHMKHDGIWLSCEVRRHREKEIKDLIARARRTVSTSTIFQGKVLRFPDVSWYEREEFNVATDTPVIVNVNRINPSDLILNPPEQAAIGADVFGRINLNDEFANEGLERGDKFVFAGPYGTGKSMSIAVAMHYAINQGWTVIQFDKASQLTQAMEIAKQMQSNNTKGVLMIVEDVELALPVDKKDEEMTELSGQIDGANKDFQNTVLLMTTNEVQQIHPLFLRRCTVINFEMPQEEARIALIKNYLGKWNSKNIDYSTVANAMTVKNPADADDLVIFSPEFIRQSCQSAIAQAIVHNNKKEVSTEMLVHSAEAKSHQVLSVYRPDYTKKVTIADLVSDAVTNALTDNDVVETVTDTNEYLKENL